MVDGNLPAGHHPAPGTDLTQYRLGMIEKTLQAISENLHQLAALEQKHIETREALGRAFKSIEGQDTRLRTIEMEMPTLRLVRKWVLAGAVGMISLVLIEVLKVIR